MLDIGAGAGSIGSFLADRFEYVGIEPDATSYAVAKRRIGDRGKLLNCGFEDLEPRHDFDLVCAFEVLEHIEDDAAAVQRWVQHLRAGGRLLVSVPQGRHRFSAGDARMGHFRRYDPEDLDRLFESTGLRDTQTVVFGSPWGNFQEAVRGAVFRIRPSSDSLAERTAASGRFSHPPGWAARLSRAVALPLEHLQRPFSKRGVGTSVVAIGTLDSR